MSPSGHADPADYNSASESPDPSAGIDTLEDHVMEAAAEKLRNLALAPHDRAAVTRRVASVAMYAIETAQKAGLIHDDDGATWTPKFREIISKLLAEIIFSKRPGLVAECIDIVFGLGIQGGVSEAWVAAQHGVTRSNVSGMCVALRERYEVPPSRGMRSVAACKTYAKRQKGKRARPLPQAWSYQSIFMAEFA